MGSTSPRLVYADWLEENGDADVASVRGRAEFIRVQCELARPGAEGQRESLKRREAELLADFREAWLRQIPAQLFYPEFVRGFLDPLWFGAWLLVGGQGQAVAAVAPLHHLRLFKARNGAERLSACPLLRGVRRLDLTSNVLRNGPFAALMTSPHFVNLVSLEASQNEIGVAGWKALARAELPRLRILALARNPLKNAGVEALAGAGWLGGLKQLNLSACETDARGLRALAAAPMPELEVLHLSHAGVTEEVLEQLGANPTLGRLGGLSLASESLTPGIARALLDAPGLPSLRRVDVRTHGTPPALAEELRERRGIECGPVSPVRER